MANDWFECVLREARSIREKNPLPTADDLSPAQEVQRQIVGGSIIAWLDDHGPAFLEERRMMSRLTGLSEEPGIVFTSDVAGLLAAVEIIGDDAPGTVCLLDEEFRRILRDHPDERLCHHVHFWSIFDERLEAEALGQATSDHPISKGFVYWLHREGTMWGPLAGRGVDHLWSWDGTEPELIEEAFATWVS